MEQVLLKYEREWNIGDNEFWWGGVVGDGVKMPLRKQSEYVYDMRTDGCKSNAVSGLFVSSDGRYMYTDGTYRVCVKEGVLSMFSTKEIFVGEGFSSVKEAYRAAAEKFFRRAEEKIPRDWMSKPQFCTWTAMDTSVSQEKVLSYARGIVESGFEPGVLLIDDGWSKDYGDWVFQKEKFPDPKGMIRELHSLGFKVVLWLCPFVNETTDSYPILLEKGGLLVDGEGKPAIQTWWNGDSAVLDLRTSAAKAWLYERLDELQKEYGADGFKFDAGSPEYYRIKGVDVAAEELFKHTSAWTEAGNRYRYCELREAYAFQGAPFVLRMNDTSLNWEYGLSALIPNILQAGLCGYPYVCPDMIGGGQIADFRGKTGQSEKYEIVARFCEIAALMPCMQFSYPYWEHDEKYKKLFTSFVRLHADYWNYVSALVDEAEKSFEPIVRTLEYEFPHEGLAEIVDEFMLGREYLVAPVLEEGAHGRTVVLPKGEWLYLPDNKRFTGGEKVYVDANTETLPCFRKIG